VKSGVYHKGKPEARQQMVERIIDAATGIRIDKELFNRNIQEARSGSTHTEILTLNKSDLLLSRIILI
jgi:hypothetical protein